MKAKEYLKQSGYNKNYTIGVTQICRLLQGFSNHQNKELIKKNEELIQSRDYFASICIESGLVSKT